MSWLGLGNDYGFYVSECCRALTASQRNMLIKSLSTTQKHSTSDKGSALDTYLY